MNKIDSQNLATLLQPKYSDSRTSPVPALAESDDKVQGDNVELNSNTVLGTKLVYQSISSQFGENIQAAESVKSDEDQSANQLFDYEAVANNVMAFVSNSIIAAKERGESDSVLAEMFEQAKQGVNQGIDEALGELDELAMLDPALGEGIEKSRTLIQDSIVNLQAELLPEDSGFSDIINKMKVNAIQQSSSISNEDLVSSSQSSDLTITTADGDKVTINFSQLQENFNSSYTEMNFSYELEGELDEAEIAAINELFTQVSAVEKEFFEGDINKAYEKVQTLGFNDEELSGFSLDLQQTQTYYVSQKYTEVESIAEGSMPEPGRDMKQLLGFIDNIRSLQESAQALLGENRQQLPQIIESAFNVSYISSSYNVSQLTDFMEKFTT